MNTLQNNIQLLQSYYRFLALGEYMEHLMKTEDLSKNVGNVYVQTGNNSHFRLKPTLLKTLLTQIHLQPDKKNIFGYLVEISSFRGIFSIMRELLDNNEAFKTFVISRLNNNYFSFEQIIRLIRNILSHTTTADINLKSDDFAKQKEYLTHEKKLTISFNFSYSEYWKEWKGAKEYGLNINIPFATLKEGDSLFDIISLHELYTLCELCYNLCEVFRVHHFPTKPRKYVGKGSNKK